MKNKTYQYIFTVQTEYPRKEVMRELDDVRIISFEFCIRAENKSIALYIARHIVYSLSLTQLDVLDKSIKIVSGRKLFKNGNSRRIKV